MKSIRILALMAVVIAIHGCATTGQKGGKWSEAEHAENYPYSELEAVYEAVLAAMTGNYFKDYPELDKEHTEALRAFIRESVPKADFVSQMIQPENVAIFERAKESREYRDSSEFQRAFEITVNVAVPMARMMMGGAIDIYVAKFVDKDPVKLRLFEIVEEEYQKEFVSWIYGEVTIEEAEKEVRDFDFQDGDKVYGFSSPLDSWENLCGREGYIVVRGDNIVHVIVTTMN